MASYVLDPQTRADVEFESKFGSGSVGRSRIPSGASKEDIETIKEMNIQATKSYRPKTTGIQPVSKDTSKKLKTFDSTSRSMKVGEKRTYGTTRVLKTKKGYRKYEVGKPTSSKSSFAPTDYSQREMQSFFSQTSDQLKGTNPYLERK